MPSGVHRPRRRPSVPGCPHVQRQPNAAVGHHGPGRDHRAADRGGAHPGSPEGGVGELRRGRLSVRAREVVPLLGSGGTEAGRGLGDGGGRHRSRPGRGHASRRGAAGVDRAGPRPGGGGAAKVDVYDQNIHGTGDATPPGIGAGRRADARAPGRVEGSGAADAVAPSDDYTTKMVALLRQQVDLFKETDCDKLAAAIPRSPRSRAWRKAHRVDELHTGRRWRR
jgi:hypothetical protein